MSKCRFPHPLASIFKRQRFCRNIGGRLTVNIQFLGTCVDAKKQKDKTDRG
jgi:hypothetical protein